MTTEFSDASRLLVQNWDVVKEVHKAEGELSARLRDFLFAFEQRFAKCQWWGADWRFIREADTQIYIGHNAWKRTDGYAIWIGVENFSAEALFGTDTFASLYVWVEGKRPQLVSALRRTLEDETDIIGGIQTRGNSAYVVITPLRKCLPEELDTFDDVVGTPIVDFFSSYAARAALFTRVLNDIDTGEIEQRPEGDK